MSSDSWDDRLVLMHVVVVDYVPLTSMVGESVSKPLSRWLIDVAAIVWPKAMLVVRQGGM